MAKASSFCIDSHSAINGGVSFNIFTLSSYQVIFNNGEC